MSPHPKAHGCILFNYVFEVQVAQLAISDSHSMLQEQEHNQGRAVHCKRSYLLPGTKILIVLVEAGGNWYLPIFPPPDFTETHKKYRWIFTFPPRSIPEQAKSSSNPPSSPNCLDWTQWGLLLLGASSDPRVIRVIWHLFSFPVSEPSQ